MGFPSSTQAHDVVTWEIAAEGYEGIWMHDSWSASAESDCLDRPFGADPSVEPLEGGYRVHLAREGP